jgi:hypothetical protein
MKPLHWNALLHSWVGEDDHRRLLVDERTYDRVLRQYLAQHGLLRRCWYTLLCEAEALGALAGTSLLAVEERWRRQCALETALQADLAFWATVPGVRVLSVHDPWSLIPGPCCPVCRVEYRQDAFPVQPSE